MAAKPFCVDPAVIREIFDQPGRLVLEPKEADLTGERAFQIVLGAAFDRAEKQAVDARGIKALTKEISRLNETVAALTAENERFQTERDRARDKLDAAVKRTADTLVPLTALWHAANTAREILRDHGAAARRISRAETNNEALCLKDVLDKATPYVDLVPF